MILMLALAVVGVALARRYLRTAANPWRFWLWLGFGLLLLIIASGRLALLFPVLGAFFVGLLRFLPVLLPMLLRLLPLWLRQGSATGAPPGGGADISTAESAYLRMRLDHASGEIGGEILKGRHAGRQLAELAPAQLAALYDDYLGSDAESATLLKAYLDRVYGADWEDARATHNDPPASRGGKMGAEEARQVLGLAPGAGREEIIHAHRRLMQKLHPDRGGSDYLAAKINQAKDVLLGS